MDTTSTPPFRITKSVLARAVSLQFATWLAEQTDAEGRSSPSESRAQGVDGDNLQPTTSNGNRSRKRKGKEKISSSQDDQEDGDGSSNGRDKKPKLSKGSQTNGKLFACPFAKRRPQPLACCVERGFENTSRVKEHIYRRHFVFQCVRCGTVFGKKEHWKGHQRSTQACEVVVYELCSNAINQDKQEAMRCRVGLTNMSEEEKWHHIYKIIYPDAVHPYPSPCKSISVPPSTWVS
ncbi:hypothetical protein F4820DRAFT_274490 [Hypoxylon rubiginosum]|uniref:Uncharacterized protein n=1 Tax=Hypoxylon rubiginosum TaxID=110542 RepID=A0ACB9Z2I5_9PEZI|nr:hypothetical protein F4820DRAFT_274490 [Hypoxylon rubiginosum]